MSVTTQQLIEQLGPEGAAEYLRNRAFEAFEECIRFQRIHRKQMHGLIATLYDYSHTDINGRLHFFGRLGRQQHVVKRPALRGSLS